jgi:hypothetical protein
MTIDEAIQLVRKQYENDLESAYVFNPVAHALYEVWRKADLEKSGPPRAATPTRKEN